VWFKKTRTLRCPDGTTRTIYKNVNDAFPLYIPGWQGDMSANAAASSAQLPLDKAAAELKGSYASKVQGLLIGIDELTQALMLNFRTVYVVYEANPCANSEFLAIEVRKLVAEQQRLSKLRIQVRALIDIVKSRPSETVAILTLFKDVAGNVGGVMVADVATLEIREARELAAGWGK
jgi:hypothetical protein